MKTNYFLVAVVLIVAVVAGMQFLPLQKKSQNTPSSNLVVSPRPEYLESTEGNIRVYGPVPNAKVGFNFSIAGQARVFENVVNVRIENQDSRVMYEGYVTAHSPDVGQFGWFLLAIGGEGTQLKFQDSSKTGVVTVYAASAKDGSETNVVKIPVSFEQNNGD